MVYVVRIKPSAEKEIKKLAKKDYYRILSAIVAISSDPFSGKKLEGEYQSCYSLRIWPYRIIYQIYQKELLVIIIALATGKGYTKKEYDKTLLFKR